MIYSDEDELRHSVSIAVFKIADGSAFKLIAQAAVPAGLMHHQVNRNCRAFQEH